MKSNAINIDNHNLRAAVLHVRMSSLKTKDLGVIYTPKEISTYLCRNTIIPYVLDKVNDKFGTLFKYKGHIGEILDQLDRQQLIFVMNVIKRLKILDPAVGTGHFLLQALRTLEEVYTYLIRKETCHWNEYQVKEWIITHNLYGIDISQVAIDMCRSRLSSILDLTKNNLNTSESLLKLGSNIRCGNSLIGPVLGESQHEVMKIVELRPFYWDQEFPKIMDNDGFDLCLGNPPWNIMKPVEKEFFGQYDPRLTKYGVDKKEAKKIIVNLLEQEHIKKQWDNYRRSIRLVGAYFRSKEYQYQSDEIQGVDITRTVSGDLNLYKLFLERIYYLLRPRGYCGVIIPSGFHTDAGTKGLRRLLFDENQVRELYSFENRKGVFPSIHKSFKFDLLIFKKTGKTESFSAAFMLHNPAILEKISNRSISVNWRNIKHLSPSSWSILEFKTLKDIELANQMYQHPSLRTEVTSFWKVRFSRELDISLDSKLFNKEQKGLIIFEGKMIEQFTHKFKEPRYWIKKENVLLKFGSQYQDYNEYRLGFRSVAASTNRRTMIATIIPRNVCCGNSLIVTKVFDPENNIRLIEESDLLYLCGVFNSFVFDYLLRLKVTTNLNMFFIYDMPVPRLSKHDSIYQEIVRNVADLFPEFDSLHKQFGKNFSHQSFHDRIQCRATIDSLIAKIYELDIPSIEYILDQFHLKDPRKEEALTIQKNAILARFD
ncbi:MAG: Eco57I restriction-modification methylase domain-containing protein [Promethearchaeota archaeon]